MTDASRSLNNTAMVEGQARDGVNYNAMTIDEHLRSMPTPPWLDQTSSLFRPPQDLTMLAMSPHAKLFQAPPTCHQQPVIVSRCDVAVPSSSDTSSSSCSPSSNENALLSTIKPDSSVDASVAAILNDAMKPEPPLDSNDYLHAMQQRHPMHNTNDIMALHIGYGLRCSSSSESPLAPPPSSSTSLSSSAAVVPSVIRRSRSSQDGMLKCQFCPKKWADQSSLQIHMQDCRLIRCHECASCGKRFKARGGLQQHLRIHNNERPYACHYCAKRFTQKSHVDQHERIHTGAKPFTCQFCGRAFRQRSQQMGHEATHVHNTTSNTIIDTRHSEMASVAVSQQQQNTSSPPTSISASSCAASLPSDLTASLFPLQMTQSSCASTAVNSLLALSQNSSMGGGPPICTSSSGGLPRSSHGGPMLALGQHADVMDHHAAAMQHFQSHNMHQAILNQML